LREELLLGTKFCRMHAAATALELNRMPQVQHLVINDVLHGIARDRRMIKKTTNHNCIVSGIVVTQHISRTCLAPAHPGTRHHPCKQSEIEVFKDGLQIVNTTLRRRHAFTATHLPDQMRLAAYGTTLDIPPVPGRLYPLDRLAIHFRQKNMSDRAQHSIGRAFQQIRQPYQQFSFAQTNGVVDVRECEELYGKRWRVAPRTKFAKALFKDLDDVATHLGTRLACGSDESDCRSSALAFLLVFPSLLFFVGHLAVIRSSVFD